MEHIELLDACDVLYEVQASDTEDKLKWYVMGYLSSVQTSESRGISRRPEIGSNATILLVEESQKSMSFQRLNTARKRGNAPYNMNFPAMIKWILSGGTSKEKILIDLDPSEFAKNFDIRKTTYSTAREQEGTGQVVSRKYYRNAKIAQHSLGVGAASKYLEDAVAISWEKTEDDATL